MPVRFDLQGIQFEWDAKKATANRSKHGVDFKQACEVFFDPFLHVFDASDEAGETREGVLGLTRTWQLLLVVFVERGETFRIISARRATRMERRLYEDQ